MKEGSIRKNFLYRHFASAKTAIYLLFVLFFFFIIGTIFPQGVELEKYREAGGKFLFAAKHLGFLNIFETPLFILTAFILALNALVCTIERSIVLAKRRSGDWIPGKESRTSYEIPAGTDIRLTLDNLKFALKKRGFKVRKEEVTEIGDTLTFGRGINLAAASIIFHSGIFLCLLLFFSTHYFAYENFLTIYPGETKDVALPDKEVAPFQLKLNEFSTLYEDNPKIEFPKKAHMKIASLISKPGEKASFKLEPGAIAVSDWISDLSVQKGGEELLRKKIEVNVPLRHGGFTFYQMGYDQQVELLIQGEKKTISPGEPFGGKQDERLAISNVKHGTLNKLDGSEEKIKPYITLYRLKEGGSRRNRDKVGNLSLGERQKLGGMVFKFIDFKESSVLSYRVDPSVNILYYLSFLVIILITARLYLRQSRLKIVVSKRSGNVTVSVSLRSEGAIYFRRSEEEKIEDSLEEIHLRKRNQSCDSSSTS